MIKRNISRFIVLGVALFVGIMIWYAIVQKPSVEIGNAHNLRSWQESDVTPGYPVSKHKKPRQGDTRAQPAKKFLPRFDPRIGLMNPFERYTIPVAPRFDHPLGTANGAFAYNAQPYWALNKKRGGHHTGDDLNGIGGMNTDLGDPVYSAGNGRVIYAGTPSKGWGKTILVAHRLPKKEGQQEGALIQTMYAHLHQIHCLVGTVVSRGEQIGEVGGADGVYLAHLHLEMRASDGVEIGRGYSFITRNRMNPIAEINGLRNSGNPEDLAPSVLTAVEKSFQPKNPVFPQMDLHSAERLSDFMDKGQDQSK